MLKIIKTKWYNQMRTIQRKKKNNNNNKTKYKTNKNK